MDKYALIIGEAVEARIVTASKFKVTRKFGHLCLCFYEPLLSFKGFVFLHRECAIVREWKEVYRIEPEDKPKEVKKNVKTKNS